jgi:hypothetical protein
MKPVVSPDARSIPYKLDSISWRKPGILEVEISCFALTDGFTKPSDPNVGDFVDFGDVTPVLEGYRRQNLGTATRVVWVFRAGKEIPDSPTDRQISDTKSQWSMDVSLMQAPLTTHPNLMQIMEVGGGVLRDGEVDFPRMINGAKNTYYGTTDFLVPSVTMSCDTIEPSSNMSFNQIDGLGYSRRDGEEQKPIGKGGADIAFKFVDVSKPTGRRAWLLISHTVRRAGTQQYESKTWRYGGVLGWADPMYDEDYSFSNSNSSSSPGLGGNSQSPMGATA